MKSPDSILVIRFSSLGDIVLASLLLRRLQTVFPKTRIDMLVKEPFAQIVDGFNEVNESYFLSRSPFKRVKLLRTLRENRYDVVIDLQNNARSRIFTARLHPRGLFRYRRPRLNRWARINIGWLRAKLPVPPVVPLSYLRACQMLGLRDEGEGLSLQVPGDLMEAAAERINLFRREYEPDAAVSTLMIAPGAKHGTKRWPAEKWADFLNLAYREGYCLQVILGSDNDTEVEASILEQVDHQVLPLAGKTDLLELAAFIGQGDALISGDSGPTHIASAVDTPCVTIFGPTVPEFGFAPFRSPNRIVQVENLNCRPCHPHGPSKCPLGHFRCMKDIGALEVLDAVKALVPVIDKDGVIAETA